MPAGAPSAGEVAAAVRGGDEHYAPHERQRLQEKQAAEFRALRVIDLQVLQQVGADLAPEPVAGVNGGALGQQAALAVADDHHLAQRGVRPLGVAPLHFGGQRRAQVRNGLDAADCRCRK